MRNESSFLEIICLFIYSINNFCLVVHSRLGIPGKTSRFTRTGTGTGTVETAGTGIQTGIPFVSYWLRLCMEWCARKLFDIPTVSRDIEV